jgi:hypothetical protein
MRPSNPDTIMKTLLTARFIDGFWERWLAHGVEKKDLVKIRPYLTNKDNWIYQWQQLAQEKTETANELRQYENVKQAEYMYRVAGLYLNLIQWIFPERGGEKEKWFRESLRAFNQADSLSSIKTTYVFFEIEDRICEGRMRIPIHPKGCIVIVNPLDSSKEELFTYEMDFVNAGFATVSFDGPGQGETFAIHGLKATKERWIQFLNRVIDFATHTFPQLPIHLFGTSSGASWAIYGSCHPNVTNTVAVSPAFQAEKSVLPDYFIERMDAVLDSDFLPAFEMFPQHSKILLFHGKKDVMVSDEDMYRLRDYLTNGKLIEYEDEGHCCNFKLQHIRNLSMQWFMEN